MKKIYLFSSLFLSLFFSNNFLAQSTCTGADPTDTAGSTGCVTLNYQGSAVEYTTVRAADGNIWLQQNLGSSQVATSSTDADAFGDLFQWGRWDDGHQIRTSAMSNVLPAPNNPTGLAGGSPLFYGADPEWWNDETATVTDAWEAATPALVTAANGCDPCRALGAGWKLPTQEEWATVVAAEPITNPAAAFDSNLKLTVAGQRTSSGSIGSGGVRGYYWSSTPSLANVNFAKYFYLTSLTINPNAGGYREQGSSVRCLKTSATAGIGEFKSIKAAVFPNPVVDIATIQSAKSIANTAVYSITGSLVQSQIGNVINLATAANGMYFVKIQFEDGSIETVKIVKK